MKERKGFVSNSSSTSFVIIVKDVSLSFDELVDKSGDGVHDPTHHSTEDKINKLAHEQKYILLTAEAEIGAEESSQELVEKLLSRFGIDTENVQCEWEY